MPVVWVDGVPVVANGLLRVRAAEVCGRSGAPVPSATQHSINAPGVVAWAQAERGSRKRASVPAPPPPLPPLSPCWCSTAARPRVRQQCVQQTTTTALWKQHTLLGVVPLPHEQEQLARHTKHAFGRRPPPPSCLRPSSSGMATALRPSGHSAPAAAERSHAPLATPGGGVTSNLLLAACRRPQGAACFSSGSSGRRIGAVEPLGTGRRPLVACHAMDAWDKVRAAVAMMEEGEEKALVGCGERQVVRW